MLFRTMSSLFQHLSDMQWTPAQSRAFAGSHYSVCVEGDKGMFADSARADYNALSEARVDR
jgi:roadblock/LC7 domain-containing protein